MWIALILVVIGVISSMNDNIDQRLVIGLICFGVGIGIGIVLQREGQ